MAVEKSSVYFHYAWVDTRACTSLQCVFTVTHMFSYSLAAVVSASLEERDDCISGTEEAVKQLR